METLRIRRGTDSDAEFFRELELQTTWENLLPEDQERLGQEWVSEALEVTHEILLARPGNIFFIAEVNGERAGLLWFGSNRNLLTGEEEAWIYNLTVLPAYRGQGVGRALMQNAEQYARERDYASLALQVAVHNQVAIDFYHRLDYCDSNIVMRKSLRSGRRVKGVG